MKTVIKYPGAKNRIASWIVSYIPYHKVYVEPYAGSLAVLFNKPRSHIETVNDLHKDLVLFYKVLRDQPNQLIRCLELTPYSRTEYNNAYIVNAGDNEVEVARKFAVRCWQGFGASNMYKNGFKSGQQTSSPNPARAWGQLNDTLIHATLRLKNVQIECLDALDLIQRYNTNDVFIYVDPPYLPGTRKGYLYKYEMTYDDHVKLLELLLIHPGKVLLSGYDNDLYNRMLVGWYKEQKEARAEAGLARVETLWMNYEI